MQHAAPPFMAAGAPAPADLVPAAKRGERVMAAVSGDRSMLGRSMSPGISTGREWDSLARLDCLRRRSPACRPLDVSWKAALADTRGLLRRQRGRMALPCADGRSEHLGAAG